MLVKIRDSYQNLQCKVQGLRNEVGYMQHQKQELQRDCQIIQQRKIELTDTLNMLHQNFDIQRVIIYP